MSKVIYTSTADETQWPTEHPLNPSQRALLPQLSVCVGVQPLTLHVTDSQGMICMAEGKELIYTDPVAMMRPHVGGWWHQPGQPLQERMPDWVVELIGQLQFYIPPDRSLLILSGDGGETFWLFFLRFMYRADQSCFASAGTGGMEA